MNLYKSNISVLKSFSIHEQTLNTHTSDGTTKKLSNTQGKNKTTVLVGVCVRSQLRSRTVYGTLH